MLNFERLFINSKHFLKQTVKVCLHVRQIEMYKWYDNNVYKIKVFTQWKNDPVHHLRWNVNIILNFEFKSSYLLKNVSTYFLWQKGKYYKKNATKMGEQCLKYFCLTKMLKRMLA